MSSPRTIRILDPVQNDDLRLATGSFRSSPITSFHVESIVLPLDLHRESLAMKALLRPYLLPSSPVRSSSSWKLALLVHPRLLDASIVDFNILESKFLGAPPWIFTSVRFCLFLSKLVKVSHSPFKLCCSALEHARVHAPYVSIYTDGSKSSEGVGCAAVFPEFDVFISLPVAASIFTTE